jgi:hypothetical protein
MPVPASLLGATGIVWTLIAVLVPLYAILAITFGNTDPILGLSRPLWNPVMWRSAEFEHVLQELFTGGLGRVWIRTTA